MKIIWALLCETTIVNRDNNNISLINVVDEITIPASPPQGPSGSDPELIKLLALNMVVLWVRSNLSTPESGEARIKVVAPDDIEILSAEMKVDLTESQRVRAVGQMTENFPFTQEGQYLFKIAAKTTGLDWQELFELPLWVNVQTDDPLD